MAPEPKHILTIRAFQVAEAIDIKRCRSGFPGDLVATAPQELFYRRKPEIPGGDEGYLYVMDYGVVIFAGYSEAEMTSLKEKLQEFCVGNLDSNVGEDFRVHAD